MAGVTFTGDSRKLQRLIGHFEEISTARFRRELNKKMAAEALELAHDGFERSIDPYGRRWKNPRYRTGQPLRLTGRLEASLAPSWNPESFAIRTNVVYGATHQYGRDAIPQRMFLPMGSSGFGGRWSRALFGVAHEHLMKALGR